MGWMSEPESITLPTKHAERAQESVRALAYLLRGAAVPAPEAHALIGELALTMVRAADVLRDLGNGVRLSLVTHEVFEADGSDPSRNAVQAQTLLQGTADQCAAIVDDLWRAREALAGQGHRGPVSVSVDEVLF